MSVSTGRMSRASAYATLSQISSAAQEFVAKTPSDPANPEALAILEGARLEHDYLDASKLNAPNAAVIRDLRTRVAALQADRLFRSSAIQPYTVRASVVFLPGIPDSQHAIGQAAHLAARDLGLRSDQVRLQDCSNVRTATFTGVRYIFLPKDL